MIEIDAQTIDWLLEGDVSIQYQVQARKSSGADRRTATGGAVFTSLNGFPLITHC
jgi:hypothetical protein